MELVDLEGKLDSNEPSFKRPDMEKTAGEAVDSGDAKRLRESNHDRAIKMDMDDEEEDDEVDMEQYKPFGMYCKNWIYVYGDWAKFDDPSMYIIYYLCACISRRFLPSSSSVVTGRSRHRRGVIRLWEEAGGEGCLIGP